MTSVPTDDDVRDQVRKWAASFVLLHGSEELPEYAVNILLDSYLQCARKLREIFPQN